MAASPNRETWPTLMAQAQDGDQTAYCRLLNEISVPIKSFLMKRVVQKDQVDDIAQEILLAIHKVRHTYQPDQPFENWMYGIARHKMIDFFRKNRRKLDHELVPEAEIETFGDIQTNDSDRDLPHDLEKALNGLPNKQKKIVVMIKIQGHSIADVANELGMTESAVKVSAHRAYKKLKNTLVAYGY